MLQLNFDLGTPAKEIMRSSTRIPGAYVACPMVSGSGGRAPPKWRRRGQAVLLTTVGLSDGRPAPQRGGSRLESQFKALEQPPS